MIHLIGVAENTKNSGYFGFHYAGAGSDDNYLKFGGYAADNLMVIKMNGKVGIGTTTPQNKFEAHVVSNEVVSVGAGQIADESFAGIHFGYLEPTNTSYRKSAIVFQRTDLTENNAQGRIHILNGPQSGGGSAGLGDKKFTITENGSVYASGAGGRMGGYIQDMFHLGADKCLHEMMVPGLGSGRVWVDGGSGNYAGYRYDSENWVPNVFIPYSPNQVYRLSASIYQESTLSGTSSHYIGLIGYDENFNFVGVDDIGTYQYNMASNTSIGTGEILEVDVCIKGWQGAGGSDGRKMDEGTVYIRPMMLLNYGRPGCKAIVTGFIIAPAGTISNADTNAGTNY